jgi:hypothetical protein
MNNKHYLLMVITTIGMYIPDPGDIYPRPWGYISPTLGIYIPDPGDIPWGYTLGISIM